MEIKFEQTGSRGAFYIGEQHNPLGKMVFSNPTGEVMIIEHTEVSDALKGQGAGKQLVHAAVEYARKNNIRVFPACTFARSVFAKVKEYQDVLAD